MMYDDDYIRRMNARALTNQQDAEFARRVKWPKPLVLPQNKVDDTPPGGWKVTRVDSIPRKIEKKERRARKGSRVLLVSPDGDERIEFDSTPMCAEHVMLHTSSIWNIITGQNTSAEIKSGKFTGWKVYKLDENGKIVMPEYRVPVRHKQEAKESKAWGIDSAGRNHGGGRAMVAIRIVYPDGRVEEYGSIKAAAIGMGVSKTVVGSALHNGGIWHTGPRKGVRVERIDGGRNG